MTGYFCSQESEALGKHVGCQSVPLTRQLNISIQHTTRTKVEMFLKIYLDCLRSNILRLVLKPTKRLEFSATRIVTLNDAKTYPSLNGICKLVNKH